MQTEIRILIYDSEKAGITNRGYLPYSRYYMSPHRLCVDSLQFFEGDFLPIILPKVCEMVPLYLIIFTVLSYV